MILLKKTGLSRRDIKRDLKKLKVKDIFIALAPTMAVIGLSSVVCRGE